MLNKLPNELLDYVDTYLDFFAEMSLSRSCKMFSELVDYSSLVSKVYQLNIPDQEEAKIIWQEKNEEGKKYALLLECYKLLEIRKTRFLESDKKKTLNLLNLMDLFSNEFESFLRKLLNQTDYNCFIKNQAHIKASLALIINPKNSLMRCLSISPPGHSLKLAQLKISLSYQLTHLTKIKSNLTFPVPFLQYYLKGLQELYFYLNSKESKLHDTPEMQHCINK